MKQTIKNDLKGNFANLMGILSKAFWFSFGFVFWSSSFQTQISLNFLALIIIIFSCGNALCLKILNCEKSFVSDFFFLKFALKLVIIFLMIFRLPSELIVFINVFFLIIVLICSFEG